MFFVRDYQKKGLEEERKDWQLISITSGCLLLEARLLWQEPLFRILF